jgi:hypothetical protein
MSNRDAGRGTGRRSGGAGPSDSRLEAPLRALLACCAASTALISAWLLWVMTAVMPLRDPSHIPLWRAITFGFVVFTALTLAVVWRGPRRPLLRMLSVLSLGALAFGAFAVRAMYLSVTTGSHFEGYQLLMGLALAAHGASALAYAWVTRP